MADTIKLERATALSVIITEYQQLEFSATMLDMLVAFLCPIDERRLSHHTTQISHWTLYGVVDLHQDGDSVSTSSNPHHAEKINVQWFQSRFPRRVVALSGFYLLGFISMFERAK